MVTFTFDTENNLIITLTEAGKQYLLDNVQSKGDEELFSDLIESYLGNGYHFVLPETIGALTSSLLLTDTLIDEESTDEDKENAQVWYYNYYAIKSYTEDLLEFGFVRWDNAG